MRTPSTLLALTLLGIAGPVLAHPGHESFSFLTGFAHPLGGLDHLLAMLAAGLYAAHHDGRQRWLLPAGFVLTMLVGAGLSATGFMLPAVETGIATSVLVLGLFVASAVRLPLVFALPSISLFALFHGYAHHTEMGDSLLLGYALGFALATALLHATGWVIGHGLRQRDWGLGARRLAGAFIALAGLVLLGG